MKAPLFRWFRAARDRTGVRPGRRRPGRFRPRARHVPERDRAQGAHPLTGDLEVVDPHIQVKLLRWPLVWPAGRAVIGDLLEHQASPAVGGVRDVDRVGVLLHPLPAEDGRLEPGGDVGVRAVHDDVHQLADRGVHPGECSRSQAGSRVSRAVIGNPGRWTPIPLAA